MLTSMHQSYILFVLARVVDFNFVVASVGKCSFLLLSEV